MKNLTSVPDFMFSKKIPQKVKRIETKCETWKNGNGYTFTAFFYDKKNLLIAKQETRACKPDYVPEHEHFILLP